MKKWIPILVLLAAAAGGGYYYYQHGSTQEKPQVVQAAITQGTIVEQVQATGTLEALRTVTVGPQVSGTISSLEGVDFNTIVHKGQVVAKLDPSLLQVQVDIQSANIDRQQTDIESQKVQLENDTRTYTRTKELFDKGLANQTQLEQADLAIKTRKAQIASSEKSLVQARANLAQAQLNVSYTEVKSPIDGVVVDRRVDVGQTVQSSMNVAPFFTIATDLTHLKLNAGVDESEIGKILPGMPVSFTVDAYPTQTFYGTVNQVRLNAQIVSNVVTYPVWIDAPNPDLKLRPSLTANVKIIIAQRDNVLRISNQALRFRPTADMYTALGLTPPAAGGRGAGGAGGDTSVRRGGQGANANARPAGPGAPVASAQTPTATAGGRATAAVQADPAGGQAQAGGQGRRQRGLNGEQGQGGQRTPGQGFGGQGFAGGQGSGRGFGGRGGFANMTPEERDRMRQQFMQNGGGTRTGRTGGGRGGVQTASGQTVMEKNPDADKIDELFEPAPTRIQSAQVYMWDEAAKKLTATRVQYGITDGQFSELVSGDLKVGQQVVTGIIVPQTSAQRTQNSVFGQPGGGRNFGGLQPGGGDRGGGGFGGGGGGGRGGGGR